MKKTISFLTMAMLVLSMYPANALLIEREQQSAFILNSYESAGSVVHMGEFEDGKPDGWVAGEHVGSAEVASTIAILGTPARSGALYLIGHGDSKHKAGDYVTLQREFNEPVDLSATPHFVFSFMSYDIGGELTDYRLRVTLHSKEKSMEYNVYPKIAPGDPWADYLMDFSKFEGISAVDGITIGRAVLNRGDFVWGDGKIAIDRLEFTYRPHIEDYDVNNKDIQIYHEKVGPYYTYPENTDMAQLAKERMQDTVVLFVGSPAAYVDAERTAIEPGSEEIRPYLENGRTMVPLRFVSQSLGAKVQWNEESNEVTILVSGKQINMKIGKYAYTVDDRELILDAVPKITNGRSFVPLRVILDEMNKRVYYNDGLIAVCDENNLWDDWYDGQIIEYLINDYKK